jgi:flavin reductase (DIM6/NTAB) family NADH-FMN oxidoreductase RutF
LVSGHDIDKSTVFKSFYGKLKTAPMIEECPLTMECKLVETIEIGNNDIILGEIVAGYVDEERMEDGSPDLTKIDPIIYSSPEHYWKLGDYLARAYSIGKTLREGCGK